jgi:AcrR family transcriptional regulator
MARPVHDPAGGARERILRAASALMAREGPKGATTRAIAGEAGVNEVTLFRLFGSKERLFQAVVDSLFPHGGDDAPLARLLERSWSDRAGLQELLEDFGRCFRDEFLEAKRESLEILLRASDGPHSPAGRLRDRAAAVRDLLAGRLDPDPLRFRDAAGAFLTGLIGGFMLGSGNQAPDGGALPAGLAPADALLRILASDLAARVTAAPPAARP